MDYRNELPLALYSARRTSRELRALFLKETGMGALIGLNVGAAIIGGALAPENPVTGGMLVFLSALGLDSMDKHGALESFKFWKKAE